MKIYFKEIGGLMAFLSFSSALMAQEDIALTQTPTIWNSAYNNIILIIGSAIFIAGIAAIYNLISKLMELQKLKALADMGVKDSEQVKEVLRESSFTRFYQWMVSLVPVEKEGTIDLGHDYDGIRELDNKLPPWWLGIMYGTIIWSVVYMYYYHFSGQEWSSEKEYMAAMEEGEAQKQAFIDRSANTVNANTVTLLLDEASLAQGKDIYDKNCIACHGVYGEGGVGPNFTDDYWIHGGSLKDIFSVITNGVPEKGMIPWKTQLRPVNIQQVSSYITTMRGTNPANAKEAEGALYVPGDGE